MTKRKCEICGEIFLARESWYLICDECFEKQKSLIPEFIEALDEEINSFEFRKVKITLSNGRLILIKKEQGGIYLFGWENEKISPSLEDTPIDIEINGTFYKGEIITIEETKIVLYIENYFGENINKAVITTDKAFLYELLKEKLSDLKNINRYKLANLIFIGKAKNLPSKIEEDFIYQSEFNHFNLSQKKAIEASQQLPLTLIWGPAGTGKTKTLAGVVKNFLKSNKKILVVAQSNRAVDEATVKIAELLKTSSHYENGEILRIGNYQKAQLTTDYPLTLPTEILKNKADHLFKKKNILLEKYKRLTEYKDFVLKKQRFIEISKTKRNIKKEIEEKKKLLEELQSEKKKEKVLDELGRILGDKEEALRRIEIRKRDLPKEIECLERTYKELELFELEFKKFNGIKLSFMEILKWEEKIQKELDIVEKKLQLIEENILKNARVICTTLTKIFSDKNFTKGPLNQFDVLIIDEASMAPLPYIFWALTRCRDILVLVGDFLQIQPICNNKTGVLSKKWLSRSIYNHLELDEVSKVKKDGKVFLLNTQYRMHPSISEISNNIFYEGLLKNGDEVKKFHLLNIPKFGESPLILVDTSQSSSCEKVVGGSRINKFHVQIIIKILRCISIYKQKKRIDLNIGIITPYVSQSSLIRKEYKKHKLDQQLQNIIISTIHKFQGGESDVIIFDTVEAPGIKTSYSLLNDENRQILNVGITRAKYKIFLIANKDFIERNFPKANFLKRIIYFFEKNGFIYKTN